MANNEGYARLSNGLWRNTKIRKIARKDPQALADWIMAISFCSDKLTDGRLTEDDMLFNLGFDEESIGRLVDLGLLDQDDDGWTIHGYLDLQNSKADVEKSKEDARQRKARSRRRNTETTEATQSHVTETKVTCDSRVTFNQNQNQNQNSLTPNVVRECAPVNETEQERKERELIDTWTPTEAHQGVADELAAQGRPRVDLDELATTFRLKLHAKGLEHYGYRSTLDGLDNAFFEWIRQTRPRAEATHAHLGMRPRPRPARPHRHHRHTRRNRLRHRRHAQQRPRPRQGIQGARRHGGTGAGGRRSMRGNGHVFAHVDWRRMDESQLDGMRYVAYTPTGVVDGRFAPMPTRNGLPMPYLVDEAIGFPVILLTAPDRDNILLPPFESILTLERKS